MLTPVFLAVPAHNEERALPRLLDSVYASALPEGMAWSEWVILDDASTDGTVEVAGAWGRAHPEVPLRVDRAPARLGMGGNLERFRRYVTAQCPDAVVVVVDADVVVEQGSLYRLLEPFQKNPGLAVAFGVDRVARRHWGRRASAFQLEVTTTMTLRSDPRQPRAYGRFFAYRVALLSAFAWEANGLVDDAQLAAYLHRTRLPVWTESRATVATLPARGWRDFALQTRRFHVAVDGCRRAGLAAPSSPRRVLLGAFIATARDDPIGAVAYCWARIVEYVVFGPRLRDQVGAVWTPASSTKEW